MCPQILSLLNLVPFMVLKGTVHVSLDNLFRSKFRMCILIFLYIGLEIFMEKSSGTRNVERFQKILLLILKKYRCKWSVQIVQIPYMYCLFVFMFMCLYMRFHDVCFLLTYNNFHSIHLPDKFAGVV